ncbi:MAG: hypothetical protein ACI906_001509 [Candidatus Latescibacterota bacterium]|jgi:hypothetical protein
MASIHLTPDLLISAERQTVAAATWPQRRTELYETIVPHEYGGMPPQGAKTHAIRHSHSTIGGWDGVTYATFEVHTTFADGQELSQMLSLWIPPGDGPFPVLLNGDGCWRYFDDATVQRTLARGNIAASFNRTEAAADNRDAYRKTGLYRIFPDASFGVLSAWAWAYHRCIDALVEMPQVRADAIAISGHSRGGKAALLAGATDERIALTNPNDSGTGGSGPNHLKAERAETVDSFFDSGNIFWFGQGFADHRYRDGELAYDQHFLHALVAPRALLVTEAYEDKAANPPGSYAACVDAQAVYQLLDAPGKIGWALREGGHGHNPIDFEALLDFMDLHLHKMPLQRDFQRPLFPELKTLLTDLRP